MNKPADILRIKEIAKEKGVLMEDIAKRLKISPQALNESISNNPKLGRLIEIAAILDVSIIDLFHPEKEYITIYTKGADGKFYVKGKIKE
jgi:transcriptional regulator with XRE-family HTH domain